MHYKTYSWLIILGILLFAFRCFALMPDSAQENIYQNADLNASMLDAAFTYQGQLNAPITTGAGIPHHQTFTTTKIGRWLTTFDGVLYVKVCNLHWNPNNKRGGPVTAVPPAPI